MKGNSEEQLNYEFHFGEIQIDIIMGAALSEPHRLLFCELVVI